MAQNDFPFQRAAGATVARSTPVIGLYRKVIRSNRVWLMILFGFRTSQQSIYLAMRDCVIWRQLNPTKAENNHVTSSKSDAESQRERLLINELTMVWPFRAQSYICTRIGLNVSVELLHDCVSGLVSEVVEHQFGEDNSRTTMKCSGFWLMSNSI